MNDAPSIHEVSTNTDSGMIMNFKECTRCLTAKPISDFYGDKRASDGKGSQCKKCNSEMSAASRRKNLERYNANKRAWRKANPDKVRLETKKNRSKNPDAYKARTAVANALAAGKLSKGVCAFCGSAKVQAHHMDYAKPLEVIWLCAVHHGMYHRVTKNKGQ